MVAGTLVLAGLGTIGAVLVGWPLAVVFAAVWIWLIAFFRDPPRRGPFAADALYAPADGTVTEITRLPDHPLIGAPAVRVGMFLSIFNVHINRSPCAGRVRSVAFAPGQFLDARHVDSGALNASNTLVLDPVSPVPGPLVVRQVAGMIARRIVCHAKPGDQLVSGERFGLIKFGSRTELIVPDRPDVQVVATLRQAVRAGVTVLVRFDATARSQ